MIPFEGFSDDELGEVALPEQFFTQLLTEIDNLEELKLTLFVFWLLDHIEGHFRYIRKQDFTEDEHLLDILQDLDREPRAVLEAALNKLVLRGTLLEARINARQGEETLYVLNTPGGQTALRAIQNGEWYYSGDPQYPVGLNMYRPNIFRIYEKNIGPLTPMIAETLQEAEQTYSPNWIEEAIRIAVENNKRSWRYIEAILRRWQEGGRNEREDRRDTEKSLRRYKEWEDSSE